MLIGEYLHTLDGKRRISLPAKFRKELGKKVVITRGLDSSLFVFPASRWKTLVEKLANLSMGQSEARAFNRFFLASAQELEVDALGRVLLPEYLARFAELNDKVVLIGVHDRIELWSEARWHAYRERTLQHVDVMAEKLGDLGLI